MSGGTTATDRCEICGQENPKTIETHHVVPQRYGGSDYPENLVKLCGSCHNAIERIYDDEFYQRLSSTSPQFADPDTDSDLGYSVPAERSLDREFPGHAMHVITETLHREEMVSLGVLDEEDLNRVTVTIGEKIEELKQELQEKQNDRDQKQEPEDSNSLIVDSSLASGNWAIKKPISHTRTVKRIKNGIEHWESLLDDGYTLDTEVDITSSEQIEGQDQEIIHCAYCDTIFPEWEAADAAKHLQLKHHIDNPYEEKEIEDPHGVL